MDQSLKNKTTNNNLILLFILSLFFTMYSISTIDKETYKSIDLNKIEYKNYMISSSDTIYPLR
jgi:hypothetical protein